LLGENGHSAQLLAWHFLTRASCADRNLVPAKPAQ
jgi:hypothetical protein